MRLNLDHEMNNWLTMGVNLQLSRREHFTVNSDNGFRGQVYYPQRYQLHLLYRYMILIPDYPHKLNRHTILVLLI